MKQVDQGTIHPEFKLGDVLPSYADSQDSDYLYVSLSELMMEKVFYHPSIAQVKGDLTDIEVGALDAILFGESVDEHFVETLSSEILMAKTDKHDVVKVCLSSNDSYAFRSLLGGQVEEDEINPSLGLRGVSRFVSDAYSHAFSLECNVIKSLVEKGVNVDVVIPFVRTLDEAQQIIEQLKSLDISSQNEALNLCFSCDVPSSVMLAPRLLELFDGVVVNVEHLTQFTLGVDKANETNEHLFDPQNEAVLDMLSLVIEAAQKVGKPVQVVTQALSEYPELQRHLLKYQGLNVVVTM